MSAHTDRIRQIAHDLWLRGERVLANELQIEVTAIETGRRRTRSERQLQVLITALGAALAWWHSDYRHMAQREPEWVALVRAAIAAAKEE